MDGPLGSNTISLRATLFRKLADLLVWSNKGSDEKDQKILDIIHRSFQHASVNSTGHIRDFTDHEQASLEKLGSAPQCASLANKDKRANGEQVGRRSTKVAIMAKLDGSIMMKKKKRKEERMSSIGRRAKRVNMIGKYKTTRSTIRLTKADVIRNKRKGSRYGPQLTKVRMTKTAGIAQPQSRCKIMEYDQGLSALRAPLKVSCMKI